MLPNNPCCSSTAGTPSSFNMVEECVAFYYMTLLQTDLLRVRSMVVLEYGHICAVWLMLVARWPRSSSMLMCLHPRLGVFSHFSALWWNNNGVHWPGFSCPSMAVNSFIMIFRLPVENRLMLQMETNQYALPEGSVLPTEKNQYQPNQSINLMGPPHHSGRRLVKYEMVTEMLRWLSAMATEMF